MIGIALADGIFIYLLLWLSLLLILWGRALLRRRKNQWDMNNNHFFTCDNCHYAFLSNEPVNLTRCPRCNAICIRRTKRKNSKR